MPNQTWGEAVSKRKKISDAARGGKEKKRRPPEH